METETLYKLPTAAAILSVHVRTLKRWHEKQQAHLVELPGGQYRITGTEIKRLMGTPPPKDDEQETASDDRERGLI